MGPRDAEPHARLGARKSKSCARLTCVARCNYGLPHVRVYGPRRPAGVRSGGQQSHSVW